MGQLEGVVKNQVRKQCLGLEKGATAVESAGDLSHFPPNYKGKPSPKRKKNVGASATASAFTSHSAVAALGPFDRSQSQVATNLRFLILCRFLFLFSCKSSPQGGHWTSTLTGFQTSCGVEARLWCIMSKSRRSFTKFLVPCSPFSGLASDSTSKILRSQKELQSGTSGAWSREPDLSGTVPASLEQRKGVRVALRGSGLGVGWGERGRFRGGIHMDGLPGYKEQLPASSWCAGSGLIELGHTEQAPTLRATSPPPSLPVSLPSRVQELNEEAAASCVPCPRQRPELCGVPSPSQRSLRIGPFVPLAAGRVRSPAILNWTATP